MPRLLTRYLLLSSVLILFSHCAYHQYAHPASSKPIVISNSDVLPVIPANGTGIKYKASIDVLNKHFSGIVLLKQIDSVKHFVFITELGMKMFDFEMKHGHFAPVYVFEPLNQPKLINVLTKDFEILLLLDLYQKQAEYCSNPGQWDFIKLKEGEHLSVVEPQMETHFATLRRTFHKKHRDTRTIYTPGNASNYQSVSLKQYGLVKIYIELNEIPSTND